MYEVFNCIATEHDLSHVLAAFFVLAFSNCCSLIIYKRSHQAVKRFYTILWAIAAGTVVGLGVWATHFIALLGYQPGFDVVFDGWRTLLSAAMVVTGFVITALVLSVKADAIIRLISGAIATASVAGMHFYGMTALNASAIIEYDRVTITSAILLSFMFYTATYLVGSNPKIPRNVTISTITSVFAVLALHFISASGTTMIPVRGVETPSWQLATGLLSIIIAGAMAVIVILSVLAAGLDSKFERMRSKETRKLSVLADASSEGLFVVSRTGEIINTNTSARVLFSERISDLKNLHDLDLFQSEGQLPDFRGRNIQDLLQFQDDELNLLENREFGERRIRFEDGREMIAVVSSRCVEEKDETFIVFAVRDITQRVRAEAKVRTLAYRDSLTGLHNRVAFNMALEHAMQDTQGDRFGLAVMIIDLDEFKEVNDQFGHGAGDSLLKAIGRRISSEIDERDTVARLGGDEFAVLVRGRASAEEIQDTADRILSAISEPLAMGRRTLNSGGSIGLTFVPPNAKNAARILTYADRALYSAKAAGRGCVRAYDADLHKQQVEQRNLERALHDAVRNDEFVLYFQPKVSSATRAVVGREALIRWNRPGVGLVGPDQFIPLAEQSMLIVEIGRWTIHAACRAASRWQGDESVAVNLSARQLMDPDIVFHVRSALEETGLDPARFELEITETAIIHNTQLATSILLELKAIGIKISLDDFGTGYSSMSYVQEFPFDRIKIDRSFVATINVDSKSRAIIEAIIHLAHSLDIPVVAEGVETEDQAHTLASLSCEEMQGYLIAAPEPFEGPFTAFDLDGDLFDLAIA